MTEVSPQVPESTSERIPATVQGMPPEVLDTMGNERDRYNRMFASWEKRQVLLATGHFNYVGEFTAGAAPAKTELTGNSWIFLDESGHRIQEESFRAIRLEQENGTTFWEGQTRTGEWIRIEGKAQAPVEAVSSPNIQIN